MKRKTAKKKKFNFKILLLLLPLAILVLILSNLFSVLAIDIDNVVEREALLSKNRDLYVNVFVLESTDSGKINSVDALVINSDEERVLHIHIPGWLYIPANDLDWVSMIPISSLKSAGEFAKHGSGKQFTLWYIERVLGFKIDNYFWYKGDIVEYEEILNSYTFFNMYFSSSKGVYGDQMSSNLPVLNLLSEFSSVSRHLNQYDVDGIDTGNDFSESITLSADKYQNNFLQREFDSKLTEYMPDLVSRDVVRERVNVEVYNASEISGVAYSYSRRIANSGCRVLRYDNSPTSYEETVIYVPTLEGYEKSLDVVRDIVGYEYEIKYERPMFITTGDIVVVLGRDILSSFNF